MCYYFLVERKRRGSLSRKIYTKARKLAKKLSKKAIKKFKQAAKKAVLAAKNVAKQATAAAKQAVKDIKKVAKQAGKVVAIVTSGNFRECVSTALDFIPVVGNIKSGVEALTGYDPITGRKLEPWERAVSGVGILGGPAAKAVKHGGKLAVKGGKVLQQQGGQLLKQGGKLLEKGGNLLGKAADLLDSSRSQLAGAGAGYKNFSVSTGISAGKKTSTSGSKQVEKATSAHPIRSSEKVVNDNSPKRWKLNDPIDAPTREGKYPSWETVKKRYWKNRANSSSEDEFSPENLERMRKGKPPLHDEVGVSKELHHKKGRKISNPHNIENLEELWPWEHDAVDPFRHYRGPRPKGE